MNIFRFVWFWSQFVEKFLYDYIQVDRKYGYMQIQLQLGSLLKYWTKKKTKI